jgi:hypothetical protein
MTRHCTTLTIVYTNEIVANEAKQHRADIPGLRNQVLKRPLVPFPFNAKKCEEMRRVDNTSQVEDFCVLNCYFDFAFTPPRCCLSEAMNLLCMYVCLSLTNQTSNYKQYSSQTGPDLIFSQI